MQGADGGAKRRVQSPASRRKRPVIRSGEPCLGLSSTSDNDDPSVVRRNRRRMGAVESESNDGLSREPAREKPERSGWCAPALCAHVCSCVSAARPPVQTSRPGPAPCMLAPWLHGLAHDPGPLIARLVHIPADFHHYCLDRPACIFPVLFASPIALVPVAGPPPAARSVGADTVPSHPASAQTRSRNRTSPHDQPALALSLSRTLVATLDTLRIVPPWHRLCTTAPAPSHHPLLAAH